MKAKQTYGETKEQRKARLHLVKTVRTQVLPNKDKVYKRIKLNVRDFI